jgi:D-alanyl-D-alanine carboxypeptidase
VIQVGATESAREAADLLARARGDSRAALGSARPVTEKVQKGRTTLYRARFAGLEPDQAEQACRALKRSGFACFAQKD